MRSSLIFYNASIGICIIFFASQNLHILSRNFSTNTHLLLLLCIISFMCFFVILFFLQYLLSSFFTFTKTIPFIYFCFVCWYKKNFHPRPIIDLRISFLLISYLMNSISSITVVSIAHQKYYLILQNNEHFNFVVNIILKVQWERFVAIWRKFINMNQIHFWE